MLTIDEIRTLVTPLVNAYPVRRVILFGSYAKGTATEHSDVDLIIDGDGQLNGFDFFGIVGDLVKKMPVEVDVFEFGEVKRPSDMFDSISKEGVVIFER
jgi:predicted nucleotidyltransferase